MKLVVGLGNPGQRYDHTRHNLGFMVLDEFAKQKGLKFHRADEAKAELVHADLGTGEITFAKPQTMMNLSGQAVRAIVQRLGIEADEVLVVSDDFNLEFGQLRVRQGGESGGHNGLASVIQAIGEGFWRFRIGVASGHLDKSHHSEFVTAPFSPDEQRQLKHLVERAAELLEEYLVKGELAHDTTRLV